MDVSGTILGLDDAGFIVKQASADRIQPAWWPPLQWIIEKYVDACGPSLRSVYVRGSVPLGRAREFVSDIDTFCLVDGAVDCERWRWMEGLHGESTRRWPFVESVELSALPVTEIRNDRVLAGTIKTQSACVWGNDYAAEIPGFRPGIDMFAHGWDLPRDLAQARHRLGRAGNCETDGHWAGWALKRLIRSGFELVMERAGCFTRDLNPCCRLFGRYYPEQAAPMADALELVLRRNCGFPEFDRLTRGLGDWLYEEICRTYGAARIGQLLQQGCAEGFSAESSESAPH